MHWKKRNLLVRAFALSMLLSVAQVSCTNSAVNRDGPGSQSGVDSSTSQPSGAQATDATRDPSEMQDFTKVLAEVANGVGQVGATKGASASRRLCVFEEKHTSVASQFEIALMLLRLYERHGLRDIVLEGLTEGKKFPDTQWFRRLGGSEDAEARNEVLVGLLREGEISAVELIAMAYPDVVVHAGDDASAYAVELTKQGGVGSTIYLYKIGLKSVRQEHYARLNELNQQHKVQELVEYVISLDPWARERYERAKKSGGRESIEDLLREFREIEERAQSVGAELSADERRAMSEARAFFEAADKRSHTLVRIALGVEPKNPLVALNIGAAHTEGVKRLLDNAKATYGVLTPLVHVRDKNSGDLSYESFERKGDLHSVTWTGKGLGSLLDGRKKPPPVAGEKWFRPFSELRVATVLLLRAYRDKGSIDPDLKRRVSSFEHVRIDWSSMDFKAGELSFNASTDAEKGWTNISVRAGTPKIAEAARKNKLTLEQMLLRDLDTVKQEPGERKEPPKSPVVEVITPDVVAAFATDSAALKSIRVSI